MLTHTQATRALAIKGIHADSELADDLFWTALEAAERSNAAQHHALFCTTFAHLDDLSPAQVAYASLDFIDTIARLTGRKRPRRPEHGH